MAVPIFLPHELPSSESEDPISSLSDSDYFGVPGPSPPRNLLRSAGAYDAVSPGTPLADDVDSSDDEVAIFRDANPPILVKDSQCRQVGCQKD